MYFEVPFYAFVPLCAFAAFGAIIIGLALVLMTGFVRGNIRDDG